MSEHAVVFIAPVAAALMLGLTVLWLKMGILPQVGLFCWGLLAGGAFVWWVMR